MFVTLTQTEVSIMVYTPTGHTQTTQTTQQRVVMDGYKLTIIGQYRCTLLFGKNTKLRKQEYQDRSLPYPLKNEEQDKTCQVLLTPQPSAK